MSKAAIFAIGAGVVAAGALFWVTQRTQTAAAAAAAAAQARQANAARAAASAKTIDDVGQLLAGVGGLALTAAKRYLDNGNTGYDASYVDGAGQAIGV